MWLKRSSKPTIQQSIQADINSLVADSHLVVNYATRIGKKVEEGFLKLLRRADNNLLADQATNDDDVTSLTTGLSNMVQAIAPVTLLDLGSGWRPFGAAKNLATVVMFIIAIVTAGFTAYLSLVYVEANAVLKELENIQNKDNVDKAAHLYRFFTQN